MDTCTFIICPICDEPFSSKPSLRKHLRTCAAEYDDTSDIDTEGSYHSGYDENSHHNAEYADTSDEGGCHGDGDNDYTSY